VISVMNRPLLSILITTFNRAYFLKKLLKSISENCSNYDDIEIVVFNNGSTDNTQNVIEEFKNKIPGIKTDSVKDTLDFTGGFFKLASMGNGKYFWYIGDDDFITMQIDVLISFLKQEQPDIVLLNHLFYIQEKETDNEKIIDKKNFLFNRNEKAVFSNYMDFIKNIKHVNGFFTHIATCVFKKEKFTKFISNEIIEKYKKSRSHHIFLFLSVLKSSEKIVYLDDKLICLRIGAPFAEWFTLKGRVERIKMSTEYFVEMVKDVFEEGEVISHFKTLILKQDVFVLIIGAKLKLENTNFNYFLKIFKMLKKNYSEFYFLWFAILPMILIPSFCYKILYNIYLKFR